MNITDNQFKKYTLGLSDLNKEAFSKMVEFNNRIVSIEPSTSTSTFMVNTGCIHKANRCAGSMHFTVKKTGINLLIANFKHTDDCKHENKTCNGVIDETKSNFTDWKKVLKPAIECIQKDITDKYKLDKFNREHFNMAPKYYTGRELEDKLTSLTKLDDMLDAFKSSL